MNKKLSEAEREQELNVCIQSGWTHVNDRDAIFKVFKFKSFIDAFSWMTAIGFWAEKLNHHPEWLNVYNRVEVTLTTHDVQGLSQLDIQLADKMDSVFDSNVTYT